MVTTPSGRSSTPSALLWGLPQWWLRCWISCWMRRHWTKESGACHLHVYGRAPIFPFISRLPRSTKRLSKTSFSLPNLWFSKLMNFVLILFMECIRKQLYLWYENPCHMLIIINVGILRGNIYFTLYKRLECIRILSRVCLLAISFGHW